ncbi:MAG: hypothetical protein H7Y42_11580 [Chitinophagaceae bacterium]|nr:hypothetical protein [Chitinophagaceae bacterium]
MSEPSKDPIINCHTHTFTGDNVPPLLAKSLVPAPLHLIVNFRWVFKFFRWWYRKGPGKTKYGGLANEKEERKYSRKMLIRRHWLLNLLITIIGTHLTLQATDIILHWAIPRPEEEKGWLISVLQWGHRLLSRLNLLLEVPSFWLKLLLILIVLIFFKSGRNFLFFLLKNTVSALSKIPGKQTRELFLRYLTIGRFTFHSEQHFTLSDLQGQYPEGSGFVVLPMDMEYMDAGKVSQPYENQLEDLATLKKRNHIYPFVFVDPRRMADKGSSFFEYDVVNGKVVLKPGCFIQKFIEQKKFSGFKIYPALGYYPFDPLLLPLWKYAEQNKIPILTHCVRGPMFYRGSKKKEWDHHPIFEQVIHEGKNISTPIPNGNVPDPCADMYKPANYSALLLPQTKNSEFTTNFTHPLNFICLLKRRFLAKAVDIAYSAAADGSTKQKLIDLFGLTPSQGGRSATISNGLDDLKICMGHYGGADEWLRYFEKDRYDHSAQLSRHPESGIDFLYTTDTNNQKTCSFGKPEQLWKYTDWYSIISSMILQHRNVYADISYILHSDAEVLPLLKQTMRNPKLRRRILYGTDFYVVRNHKSDRNMLADMMGGLSETDFDQIARINPRHFLNLYRL